MKSLLASATTDDSETLTSYKHYERSVLAWADHLPADWETVRLRWVFDISSGDALYDEPAGEEYPLVGGNGIRGYINRKNTDGPVIIVGRVGALCGNVHYFDSPIWATEHALRLVPTYPVEPKYCAYALKAAQLHRLGGGAAQPVIAASSLADEALPLPSRQEQSTIVEFLNRATSKIDDLIAKKERLIELLEEKRTALITQAVTKGLDPDVPMKHSGVEWLGVIPEHWETTKLKHCLSRITSGATPTSTRSEYWLDGDSRDGFPWAAIGDVTGTNQLEETGKRITRKALDDTRLEKVPAGCLLYTIYATLGATAITGTAMYTNQAILGLVPRDALIDLEFLHWWLTALQPHVGRLSSDNTQKNLSQEIVRRLPVFLPPKDEQEEIARYLNDRVGQLSSLEAKVQEAINSVHEYRSALITAAVTGKIDVRDHAA